MVVGQQLKRHLTVRRRVDAGRGRGQMHARKLAEDRIVIDDQNFRGWSST